MTRSLSWRPAMRVVVLLITVTTVSLLLSTAARAGVMVQQVCGAASGQTPSAAGWTQTDGGGWRGGTSQGSVWTCSAGSPSFGMTLGNDRLTMVTHRLNWTYNAPAGTRIDAIALNERYRIDWPLSGNYGNVYTFRSWHDDWALANFFETPLPDYGAVNDSGWHVLSRSGVDYASLSFQIECADINNPPGGDCMQGTTYWSLSGGTISLRDSTAPQVSQVSGSLTHDGAKSGTVAITFNASDTGVGVYRAIYTVDGVVKKTEILDANGGRCAPIGDGYVFAWHQPCKLSLSGSTTLDTTTLSDGQHNVRVSIEDASGNRAIAWDGDVSVHNAPPASPPADSDGDGISDSGDGCPAVAGPASNGGCPVPPVVLSPDPVAPVVRSGGSGVCNPVCGGSYRDAVIKGSAKTRRSKAGQGFGMSVALRLPNGKPISGAVLQVIEKIARPGSRPSVVGSMRTDSSGKAGWHSRTRVVPSATYTVAYRSELPAGVASSNPASYDAQFMVVHIVQSRLTFAASPRRARDGSTLRLAGVAKGTDFPARGLIVRYEAQRAGGKGAGRARWTQFHATRTNKTGRYSSKYQLRGKNLPSKLTMRACIEKDSSWPYQSSCSRPYSIRVKR